MLVVVVVVMMVVAVAEVGEGRLGAVRIPSTVRADKERKLRAEASAGADCDCGCRNAQVDGGVQVGSRGGCGCRSVSAVVLCVVVRDRVQGEGLRSEYECGGAGRDGLSEDESWIAAEGGIGAVDLVVAGVVAVWCLVLRLAMGSRAVCCGEDANWGDWEGETPMQHVWTWWT